MPLYINGLLAASRANPYLSPRSAAPLQGAGHFRSKTDKRLRRPAIPRRPFIPVRL